MDTRVQQALQRWPDVPAAYGWLRLDRRGQWFLVDRNQPGFDPRVHGRGSLLQNQNLVEFIHRNYLADRDGGWYWQNGPQRAYADLETAPLIVRAMQSEDGLRTTQLMTHTGVLIEHIKRVCLCPDGVLYLVTEHGPASMHDLDLASLTLTDKQLLWNGLRYPIETIDEPADVALGFNRQPRAG